MSYGFKIKTSESEYWLSDDDMDELCSDNDGAFNDVCSHFGVEIAAAQHLFDTGKLNNDTTTIGGLIGYLDTNRVA